MNLKEIENILNPYLIENGFKLYEIGFVKEFGINILRVLVGKKGGINIDELAMVNEYLSIKLDNIDIPYEEYMLEVSSAGIEKEIRNEEELIESVGDYIFLIEHDHEYYGYLVAYENDEISLKINLKGRMKVIKIKYSDVKFIRHAVKF